MILVEYNLVFWNSQVIWYEFKGNGLVVLLLRRCRATRSFRFIEIIVWSFPIHNQQYIGENSNFQWIERSMMGNKPWKKTHSRSSLHYYPNRLFSFEKINMLILGFISVLSFLAFLMVKWINNIFAHKSLFGS